MKDNKVKWINVYDEADVTLYWQSWTSASFSYIPNQRRDLSILDYQLCVELHVTNLSTETDCNKMANVVCRLSHITNIEIKWLGLTSKILTLLHCGHDSRTIFKKYAELGEKSDFKQQLIKAGFFQPYFGQRCIVEFPKS